MGGGLAELWEAITCQWVSMRRDCASEMGSEGWEERDEMMTLTCASESMKAMRS